jgi:methylglyoxal synthase
MTLNNNSDVIGFSIDATNGNVTTDVINIHAPSLTTGYGIDVSGLDALTAGSGIRVFSNSADTSYRRLVYVRNENTAAVGARGVLIENKSTGPELEIVSHATGALGGKIKIRHLSTSPAAEDVVGQIMFTANDSAGNEVDPLLRISGVWTDPTDTAEAARFVFYTTSAGAANEAFRILDTGKIQVDVASEINQGTTGADVFDAYDDAVVLSKWARDSYDFAETLADMGVMERKDTGSGYFLNVQSFMFLLAGGIYQNRDRMDRQHAQVMAEIAELRSALGELAAAQGRGTLPA